MQVCASGCCTPTPAYRYSYIVANATGSRYEVLASNVANKSKSKLGLSVEEFQLLKERFAWTKTHMGHCEL